MKKSVVKLFRNFLFLCSSILSGLAFYSCGEDAGLGGAIDTKAPTLSIDYPKESGSAIRDSFILAGTVTDDKSISRVAVNVKSLDDGGKFSKTYSASFDPVKNRWWVDINKYEKIDDNHGSWQYPDGNYEFSVTAFDNAGNNSGTYSKTFEIDNTPPVFIISNPGVIKKTNLSPSAYGSLFTIDGTISDNHTISFMDVKIYNASGKCVSSETYEGESLLFYREEDIATAGGTSVQIAQYANASEENRSALNTRYSQLHESDSGTEYYYAEIKLTDSTKVYQDPWGEDARSADEISADQLGNSTSKLYLYDDVYASLMSAKKGLGLSAANLKDIISGVYTGSANKDEVLKVLYDKAYDTSLVEDDPMANKLSFSLNPEANPTYNVNGFEFGFNADDAVQSASTGNTVSVTISAGLDGTNIAPEIVRVWMKEYKDRPTDAEAIKTDLRTLEKQVEILEKAETEFLDALHKSETAAATTVKTGDSDWVLIYDYSLNNSKGSSVSTKTFSVTLPEGIKLSKYYILGVTGYDIEDVEFAQNSVYGFEGNTAGVPPTLKVETPANLSVWGDFAKPQFSGTATISSKSLYLTELTATLTIQDETTNKIEGEFTDTITCKIENDKQTWELSEAGALTWDSVNEKWNLDTTKLPGLVELYNTKAKTADGVYWLATLKISGKSSSGHEGESSQSIHIDTVAPKVSLASVTPSVSGSDYFGGTDTNTYLNGTVTVKGNIDEQNMADSDDAVSYDILAATGDDEPVSILAELIAHAEELGVAFDGKLGKAVTINQSFNTRLISEFFHSFKGAAEDEKIKIEVKVTVKDKAGNLGTCSSNDLNDGKYFIIYQETDRPKIELGNADASIKTAAGVKLNHNLFGTTSNNKLTISFSDDDSIAEYEVSVYNDKGELLPAANVSAQGEDSPKANPYTFKPEKTTASLSYILPSEEAKYQIEIKAHDEFYLPATSLSSPNPYGEKIVEKFFVAVDSGAPMLTIANPNNGAWVSRNDAISVSGTVSKRLDTKVTGFVYKEGDNEKTPIAALTSSDTDTTKDAKISDKPTNGVYNWTGSVKLPSDANGNYKFDVKVTDGYDQTSSLTYTFGVDISAPTLVISNVTADKENLITNKLITDENSHYDSEKGYLISGTWEDTQTGTSKLYYSTDLSAELTDLSKRTEVSAPQTTGKTSFSFYIPLSESDDFGFKIWAVDGAGNSTIPTEGSTKFSGLRVDLKKPAVKLDYNDSSDSITISDSDVIKKRTLPFSFNAIFDDTNVPDSADAAFTTKTVSSGSVTVTSFASKKAVFSVDGLADETSATITLQGTDTRSRKSNERNFVLSYDKTAPRIILNEHDLFQSSDSLELSGNITEPNFDKDSSPLKVYLVPVEVTNREQRTKAVNVTNFEKNATGYKYIANFSGLEDISYNIAIVAKDTFGNVSYYSTKSDETTGTIEKKLTGSGISITGLTANVLSGTISIDSKAPDSTVTLTVGTGKKIIHKQNGSMIDLDDAPKFGKTYYTNGLFTLGGIITETNLVLTDADVVDGTAVPTLTVSKEGAQYSSVPFTLGSNDGSGNYVWSYTPNYATNGNDDGSYDYVLTLWDKSKQQFSKTVTVVLDTAAPELSITSPSDGESFESKPIAKIAYSDDGVGIDTTTSSEAFTYIVKNITDSANVSDVPSSNYEISNGSATGTLTFKEDFNTEGTFSFSAKVKDYLGHEKVSEVRTFYFDKSKPAVTETNVGNSGLTTNGLVENGGTGTGSNGRGFTLSGSVSDTNALYNDGVADNDGKTAITISATINGTEKTWKIPLSRTDKRNATWSKTFTVGTGSGDDYLPDGTYVFTIVATDVANKTNQISRTVTVDTVAPKFGEGADAPAVSIEPTLKGTEEWYRTSDLRITGKATDKINGVEGTGIKEVYFETSTLGTDGLTWSAFANKKELAGTKEWAGTVESVASKSTKIHIIVVDNAGNTSNPFDLGPWNIDTTEPALDGDVTIDDKVVSEELPLYSRGNKTGNPSPTAVVKFKVKDETNGSGIEKVDVQLYGKATDTSASDVIRTTVTNGACVAEITADKISKSGTVYARIYDYAGNFSDVNLFAVSYDATDPKIQSSTVTDNASGFVAKENGKTDNNRRFYVNNDSSHKFTISGGASDTQLAKVELAIEGLTIAPITDAEKLENWSFSNLDLSSIGAEGKNAIITVTDKAGNTATETLNIQKDDAGPAIELKNFPEGIDVFFGSNVVLEGTVNDSNLSSTANALRVWLVPETASTNATLKEGIVTVNGTSWQASFSSLNDGAKYNIAIVATDALGNISKYSSDPSKTTAQTGTDTTKVGSKGKMFTIDTNGPTVSGILIGTAENPTSEIPADGFFVNASSSIYIKGKISDSGSGVKSTTAKYKLYSDINVDEINKTADSDSKEVTINDGTFSISISADDISKSGAINAVFFDNVGNYNKFTLANFTYDDKLPNILNPVLEEESADFKAYKTKDSSGKEFYYVNNSQIGTTGTTPTYHTFKLSGVATDNLGLNSVTLSITDGTSTLNSYPKKTGDDASDWTFTGIDLHTLNADTTATITVTDKAGNKATQNILIKLDNVAPVGLHDLDGANKDYTFRIGDGTGGKYSPGTYGNNTTIMIRGYFTEALSGLSMLYYKVLQTPPTQAEANAFLADYKTGSTGFAALSTVKTANVYSSADNETKTVESNFETTISSFEEGNNYLLLVAVDNVGNAALDTATIGSGSNAVTGCYSINVDVKAPEIEASNMEAHLTNGKSDIVITGTAKDNPSGGASGIKSIVVSLKVGETEYKSSDENPKIKVEPNSDVTGAVITTTDASLANWKVTIDKSVFSADALTSGNFTVYATVTDNAGEVKSNSQTANIGTITVDKVLDEVVLTAPSDADKTTTVREINGIINLSGTVKDTNPLPDTAIVGIQYALASTTPSETDDTGWTTLTDTSNGVSLSGNYTFSINNFDTTKIEPKNDVAYFIRAKAQDKAGNIGYSDPVAVTISQDSDRPVVNITNLTDLGEGAAPRFVLKYGTKSQVIATVSDDDGIADVYFSESSYTGTGDAPSTDVSDYSETNGTVTFTPVTANTNAISPDNKNGDGPKGFYIYVKDKAGNVFYTTYYNTAEDTAEAAKTAAETAKYLKVPKVKLGTFHKNTSDIQEFTYQSDSTSPTVVDIRGLAFKKDGTTVNGGLDTSDSADATNPYTEYEAVNASYVLGGTERQWAQFQVEASDASGIAGMAMEIKYTKKDGTEVTKTFSSSETFKIDDDTEVTAATNFAASGNNATWTTDKVSFADAKTDSVAIKVVPYDKLGLVGNGNVTLMVDNTAPTIKVNSPASGEEKTGDVSFTGSAIDKGNAGTAEVFWIIPKQSDIPDADVAPSTKLETLKNLKLADGTSLWNGGSSAMPVKASVTSWQFDFDGKYNDKNATVNPSDPDNYIFKAGNPKLDVYDSATFASTVQNGVYTLPVYFMAIDKLGNYDIKTDYVILHNPDGDRPKVAFTYPTASSYDKNSDGTSKDYITLGGTIRATGSAEIPSGTTTVKNVYLQIGNASGSFAANKTAAQASMTAYGFTIVDAYAVINEVLDLEGESQYSSTHKPAEAKLKELGFASQSEMDNWWGIKTNGSASWNIALNSDGKMNPADNSTTNDITIRACGINAEGKMGAWTQQDNVIAIHVDNAAPTLSVAIEQFASDITASTVLKNLTSTVTQPYESDMFLRGQWYLVVTALDASGIGSLTVSGTGTTKYEVPINTGDENTRITDSTTSKKGRKVFIPIDKTGTSVTYTVNAVDMDGSDGNGVNHPVEQTFTFKIDNTAPSLESITANGAAFSGENIVQNKNYVFTVKGNSTDEGSGLERVLFYYMRKSGKTKTSISNQVILDPMVKPTGDNYDAVKVAMSESDIEVLTLNQPSETGGGTASTYDLYARKVSGTATTATLTRTTGTFDSHVRVGGLITFDKAIFRRITAVSESRTEVTFEPALTSAQTGSVDAWLPIAQVIDNSATEKTSSDSENPFTFERGDDGDLMPESFSKSSKTWTWDASIHSDNLPDGPVSLVIIAFDVAGNVNGTIINTSVSNNAPRVAKLFLSTDLNNNNNFEEEEFEEYSIIGAEGSEQDNYVLDFDSVFPAGSRNAGKKKYSAGKFTAKNKLAVVPEIVGGNKSIMLVAKKESDTTITATAVPVTATGATQINSIASGTAVGTTGDETTTYSASLAASGSSTYKVTAPSFGASGEGNKFYAYVLENSVLTGKTAYAEADDGDNKALSFTFWDATEETTQGTDSQKAVVLVKGFSYDLTDGKAPTVVINPFYWQSLNSNSIYGSGDEDKVSSVSDLKGHIELEADWTATDSTGKKLTSYDGNASGTALDADPKVSGKITFTGTAYDEHALSKITATFGDVLNVVDSATGNVLNVVEIATYDQDTSSWSVAAATMDDPGYEVTVNDAGKVYSYSKGAQKTTTSAAAVYGVFNDTAYFGQKGHKIYWTLSIDTEKLTAIANKDVTLTVKAIDLSDNETDDSEVPPTISTGYIPGQELSASVTYTVTDGSSNKPAYTVDVVPYITEVKTSLSSLKSSNPSVYTRTALGHYTVRSDETVKFVGFNLGDSASLNISSLSTSGSYNFEVSGISALNNLNANNSRGAYNSTISDSSSYNVKNNYAYNRQPNNDNNNLLTDDIWFDVWQFNNRAAVPITGKIEQPVMKIRPTDGKIGFAFVNGPLYFSMGGSQSSQDYSYQYWSASYDFFTSVGFTYDDLGNSWGVAAGGDINDSQSDAFTLMSSKFGRGGHDRYASYNGTNSLRLERIGQIMSSDTPYIRKVIQLDAAQRTGIWIKPVEGEETATVQDGDILYFCNEDGTLINDTAFRIFGKWPTDGYSNNMLAFQITDTTNNVNQAPATASLGKTLDDYTRWNSGYENGDRDNSTNIEKDNLYVKIINRYQYQGFDKQRIQNPSLVTSTNGANTNVYLAYYDALNDEIRFKSGTSTKDGKNDFGQFKDSATAAMPNYDATNVSIIAGANEEHKNTGSYLNLGVIPASVTGSKDTVIAVWLDQTTNPALPTLYYAYNNDPITNPGKWTYVGRILPESSNYANAGEYCKVAVDSNGGVHIAAYDSKNLDLVYAYLPASKKGQASSENDFITCVVDSNGVVGSNLTLDVGKDSKTNNIIPYIGYYASSSIKPKMAYYIGGFAPDITTIEAGSNNDSFTGIWECATIPTASTVEMQSNQHNDINIGLWKSDGVIVASTKGDDSTTNIAGGYNSTSYGQVYGNGSKNAVLGYAIKYGTSDRIETAQMK